jgi:hypothetical protein
VQNARTQLKRPEIERIRKLDRNVQRVLRIKTEILLSLKEEPVNFQVTVNKATKQKS